MQSRWPNNNPWEQTEGDEQYDYDHLGGEWRQGKHRKYCGILTQEQFDEFVQELGLHASDIETMGSIGAPGFGPFVVNAVSFDLDSDEAIANAYVTPCGTKAELISFLREMEMNVPVPLFDDDRQQYLWPEIDEAGAVWNNLRAAIVAKYG
jgi:hypothetical protein